MADGKDASIIIQREQKKEMENQENAKEQRDHEPSQWHIAHQQTVHSSSPCRSPVLLAA